MENAPFDYEVYRINVVDTTDVFEFYGAPLREDKDIQAVIKEACKKAYDSEYDYAKSTYRWSLRSYVDIDSVDEFGSVACLTLARSTIEQTGPVVGDDDIETERARFERPVAQTMRLFFYFQRHLLVVEHNSMLTATSAWREYLQRAFRSAAGKLKFTSELHFEPKPKAQEVMLAFEGFEKLTRVRVHLRVPNPEVTRDSQELYDRMTEEQIRELLLDVRNPAGVKIGANTLARGSAAMADAGYKEGPVTLEGYKKGKKKKEIVGRNAARDSLPNGKSVLSGRYRLTKSLLSSEAVKLLLHAVDQLLPRGSDGK